MRNSISDLAIFCKIGVQGVPLKAPKIIPVHWTSPSPGWIKVNIDGAANGCPGLASCGGIFRSHCGFFKRGFTSPLRITYAFEFELMVVIKVVDYAILYNWYFIWLESDSTYVVHLLINVLLMFHGLSRLGGFAA